MFKSFLNNVSIGVVTKGLLFFNISVFLVQKCLSILDFFIPSSFLQSFNHNIFLLFSLTPSLVIEGYIWQLFTYQFNHGGILHLFFNMLVLFLMGVEIENKMGSRSFFKYYLLCGLGAGVFITVIPFLLQFNSSVPTVGASGAIYGVMMAYSFFWPDRYVYVWFVVPIKIKYLVWILIAVSFIFTFDNTSSVSHVGHLGGFITGYLYFLLKKKNIFLKKHKTKVSIPPGWRVITNDPLQGFKNEEELIDHLLSKISTKGLSNLTDKERSILEHYSQKMRNNNSIQ